MTVKKLLDYLENIVDCHPEAEEAEVWAKGGSKWVHVHYVGYDRRHKPARIKLEE